MNQRALYKSCFVRRASLSLASSLCWYCRVATAQEKQGIWTLIFPDMENTGNLVNLIFYTGKNLSIQQGAKFPTFSYFLLIWYSTKRAYVIMICPSCIVVIRRRHRHLCTALPSHRIQDRNFLFSITCICVPQYMHIKYLVILTCSF